MRSRCGVPARRTNAIRRVYASRVVDWFGEDRLLFGSDWPVCTVAASYDEVVALAEQIVGAGNERVFGGNAERVYRLS